MSSSMSEVMSTWFIGEEGGLMLNLVGEEGRDEVSEFGSEVSGLFSGEFFEDLEYVENFRKFGKPRSGICRFWVTDMNEQLASKRSRIFVGNGKHWVFD